LRPDLSIRMLRGNLDTRVNKLLDGQYDAIVVAAAGLNRLNITAPRMVRLGPPQFVPAVAQGALCLELRADDKRVRDLTAFLDHMETRDAVTAERNFLARLEGGCQVPIAAFGRVDGGIVTLTGLVADPDGKKIIRSERSGPRIEAGTLGYLVAEDVLAQGGAEILAAVYGAGVQG